jgi:hypothetical protein
VPHAVEYSCTMGIGGHEIETIKLDGHHFEFGGQGDGFCYAHQSFMCVEKLSESQKTRITAAQDNYFEAQRIA